MKNLLSAWLLITFICINAFPQSGGIKFGKIDKEFLKMEVYEKDTGASAVILADYGFTHFRYNQSKGYFQVIYEHHRRIKILKKDGYNWADHSIGLYHDGSDRESISGLKGITYNLVNGKIEEDKLQKNSIFEEKSSEYIDITKFTMPNVSVGSVIEYKYTKTSDFPFRLEVWYFQHTIPAVYSEYKVSIPEYYNYKQLQQGYLPLTVNENHTEAGQVSFTSKTSERGTWGTGSTTYNQNTVNYQNYISLWAIEDVPAISTESFITTIYDYVSKMELELASTKFGSIPKIIMDTWETMNTKYLERTDFGQQLNKKGFLKEVAATIATQYQDPEQQIEAAVEHIKSQIDWNEKYSDLCSDGIKKAYDNHSGNSAEINLALVVLLREIGLNANPVVFSNRSQGRISPIYPIFSKFNNVIAHVVEGDKTYLLDGTNKLLPYNELPFDYLSGQGRLISKEKTDWVPIKNQEVFQSYTKVTLGKDEAGELTGTVKNTCIGYFAESVRSKIKSSGENEYIKNKTNDSEDFEIENYQIQNIDNINESIEETFDITISDFSSGSPNILYIDPMLNYGLKENPLKLEERLYPVDLGCPRNKIYVLSLEIPEGYVVDEMPEKAIVALPGNNGTFRYSVSQHGNVLNVMSSYKIKKTTFLPQEYEAIKSYFNHIVAKHAEQIVLKKST